MARTPDNRPPGSHIPTPLTPDFENVQAHYDVSNAFFATFLDPTQMYSCAFFPEDPQEAARTSLEEAQVAKVDHTLVKLHLQPGQRLLDIGSGWGYVARRAHDTYGVDVVGLTLSENQAAYSRQEAEGIDGLEYRLEGWETHEGTYDAVVSIGAFEHFGRDNYPAFFAKAREFLPEGGKMLLHTIRFDHLPEQGTPDYREFLRYAAFIRREIFPGGALPTTEQVEENAQAAGLQLLDREDRGPDYARTCGMWADNLEAHREEVIAIVGQSTYDNYLKYFRGSEDGFRKGYFTVSQFNFVVPAAAGNVSDLSQ